MLHDLCMESCIDLHQNRIPGGIDIGFIDVIGYATAADSLAAIKKLVFEDKTLTMKQVIDALRSNFEGKEVIRQMMLHAPKYGLLLAHWYHCREKRKRRQRAGNLLFGRLVLLQCSYLRIHAL